MDTPHILNGKNIQQALTPHLLDRIFSYGEAPGLGIISFGENSRSAAYIKQKILFAEKIGVKVFPMALPLETTEEGLIEVIQTCNNDPQMNGVIIQLPLPEHISPTILDYINPRKDVDGLHSQNLGKLVKGETGFVPATARGVLELLNAVNISLEGKHVVIIGRSTLVGKPLALIFLKENATVTIAHSKTVNLKCLAQQADILCVAMGKPGYIGKEYVSPGQVVIDVGITVEKNGDGSKLVGDVLYTEVERIVSNITPVPGGVGPMTVYALFANVCDAYERQKS